MTQADADLLAWRHAQELLDELKDISASMSPRTLTHAAYYVMFHGAKACILRIEGRAPKTHDSIVSRFGFLAKDRGDSLRAAGRDFNDLKLFRRIADYADDRTVTPEQAENGRRNAARFLEVCGREFGFSVQSNSPGR